MRLPLWNFVLSDQLEFCILNPIITKRSTYAPLNYSGPTCHLPNPTPPSRSSHPLLILSIHTDRCYSWWRKKRERNLSSSAATAPTHTAPAPSSTSVVAPPSSSSAITISQRRKPPHPAAPLPFNLWLFSPRLSMSDLPTSSTATEAWETMTSPTATVAHGWARGVEELDGLEELAGSRSGPSSVWASSPEVVYSLPIRPSSPSPSPFLFLLRTKHVTGLRTPPTRGPDWGSEPRRIEETVTSAGHARCHETTVPTATGAQI